MNALPVGDFWHYLKRTSQTAKNPKSWERTIPPCLDGSFPKEMRDSNPLVSIITVVRNGGATLSRAIESVLAQTYKNLEYLVVDGDSQDNTREIIQDYRANLAWTTSESDRGIGHAFNKGLLQSRGQIIGFLNADDWYEPFAVETALESLKKTKADIAYAPLFLHFSPSDFFINDGNHHLLPLFNSMNHPTVFARRHCFIRHGLFREDLKISVDYEWLLRQYRRKSQFCYLDRPITHMSLGGVSTCGKHGVMENLLIRSAYGLPPSANLAMFFFQLSKRLVRPVLSSCGVNDLLPAVRRLFFSICRT